VWCGETPLKKAFPVLYGIAVTRMRSLQLTWFWRAVPSSGMLASFKQPTTGRWTSWLPSSPYCNPSKWNVKGKTSFCGLLLINGILMLDLSIRSLLAKR
jgi:hypothetical protein